MDIHDKSKEQLIADLLNLQEQNRKLKSQLAGITFYDSKPETGENTDLIDFNYFELVFNTSPDIAIISRLSDSKVIKVNDGFTKNTGYTREEALNGTRFNINLWQNPDDRQLLLSEIQKHGAFENIETTMVRKDGTAFRSLVSARLFELQGEQYVSSISRDITDLKNAEDALRKTETEIQNKFAVLNSIFESSQNIIIFSLDVNYCYTAFTTLHKQTMKLIWGVDIAVGMNMLELIQHPTDRKKAKDNFDRVLKGNHLRFEEEYGDSTLHRAYYEDIYNPIIDNKGAVVGLSVFVIDITDRKNAENKNEKTQKLLEDSQRIGKIGGWEFNIDTKELLWTKEMYSIHEVDATYIPMVHKRLDFYTPESLKVVDYNVNLAIEQGGFYEVEVEIITAKGNRKLIRTTGEADLQNRRIFGYFQDITEQKLAEQEKKASDELFKHVFEYSNVGKSITMLDGQVNTNKAFQDLLGYGSDEFQHINWMEITHPDDVELTFNEINRLKKGEVTQVRFSKRFIHKNGSIIWADLSSSALRNKEGELQSLITTIVDITENKKNEEALKRSEAELKKAQQITHIGNFYIDLKTNEVTWTEELYKMYGFDPNLPPPLLNESQQLFTTESWELLSSSIANISETGLPYEIELKTIRNDGSNGWMWARGEATLDVEGKVTNIWGAVQDITERKLAEKALKESEEKYRFIVDNAIEGIYRTSINGKALMANRALANTLGYASVEEYLNEINDAAHQVWISPDQRAEYISLLDKHDIIQGYECQMKKKDGTPIWVSLNAKIVRDEAGNKIYSEGFTEEITNRKKVELELKESEEKYKESQLIGNVAHWDYNFKTEKLYWSDQLYKMYELSKANFKPDLKKSLAASHIDDQETIRKTYFNAIQHKSDFDLESRIITPDGNIKYIITRAKPKFDENGNPTTMIGTVVDITERKKIENELKKSQEELRNFSTYLLKIRENERAEITLEIHDGIAQFLVALKVEMGLYLKKISNSGDAVKTEEVKTKMQQLVSQVDITLKSARMIMNGLRPDQLDLLGLVEATEVYLHNFEEIHHIKCSFENTVSEPIIQKEQSIVLFRILQESLTNILKHAKANSVTVKLSEIEGNLMMEIIDNGVGYDEKNISRPDSYGVISMREQVKRLDGFFSITSKPGQGTLVRVEIPYKDLKISNTLKGK